MVVCMNWRESRFEVCDTSESDGSSVLREKSFGSPHLPERKRACQIIRHPLDSMPHISFNTEDST